MELSGGLVEVDNLEAMPARPGREPFGWKFNPGSENRALRVASDLATNGWVLRDNRRPKC
jgi:hypothetical protein